MLRSAAVLTRDNVAFLLEGVPIMFRELLFPVKKTGGECRLTRRAVADMWSELCMWLWDEVAVVVAGGVAMVRAWLYHRRVTPGERRRCSSTESGAAPHARDTGPLLHTPSYRAVPHADHCK